MRFAHNLERHPTIKGAYIIYDARGFAFRATGSSGNWMARPSYLGVPPHPCPLGHPSTTDLRLFMAGTLNALAAKVGASKPLEIDQ